MAKTTRKLKPTEINHLLRHQLDPFTLNFKEHGEKPVEYISGLAEFKGRDFIVNKNVLIPRVETEKIIDIALDFIRQRGGKGSNKDNRKRDKFIFADIGTGSGVLGITLALELLKEKFKFKGILSDISEKALDVCYQNALRLIDTPEVAVNYYKLQYKKVEDRELRIIKSDLFEKFNSSLKFDLIVANLPYIPSPRLKELEASVKDFEPMLALDGGEEGLDLVLQLMVDSMHFLAKNGILIMEVDDTHTAELLEGEEELHNDWEIEFVQDSNGKNRYWVCRRKH